MHDCQTIGVHILMVVRACLSLSFAQLRSWLNPPWYAAAEGTDAAAGARHRLAVGQQRRDPPPVQEDAQAPHAQPDRARGLAVV
jgi:hypothetical protein